MEGGGASRERGASGAPPPRRTFACTACRRPNRPRFPPAAGVRIPLPWFQPRCALNARPGLGRFSRHSCRLEAPLRHVHAPATREIFMRARYPPAGAHGTG